MLNRGHDRDPLQCPSHQHFEMDPALFVAMVRICTRKTVARQCAMLLHVGPLACLFVAQSS